MCSMYYIYVRTTTTTITIKYERIERTVFIYNNIKQTNSDNRTKFT